MDRVNVYQYDEYDNETGRYDGRSLAGWFDLDAAQRHDEATRWDGNNHVSLATRSQFNHEALYRTAGGRWVLHAWSQWQGSEQTYQFLDDADAKEWLLRNEQDDAVRLHFGEIEPERGPGAPYIGQPVNTRLGDELLARVDAEATARGVTRAACLRQLVTQALA